jgi:CheY-like chemotaxis protein
LKAAAISRSTAMAFGATAALLRRNAQRHDQGIVFRLYLLRAACAYQLASALSILEGRGRDLNAKRVLIVEDDYVTAQGLSHAIADNGFAVVGPVDTADLAVRLIAHQPPDGALLDVRLRGGSAVEVAKALQERGVPFIVMSGYSQDTLPLELKQAPFVAKPMSELELIATARNTFQS